jgi:hypothetical protein
MRDPVRRVHYFSGQILTPADLQAEQDYHREMRYLHNRLVGQGVVHGLDVTFGDGSTLVIGPGLAIDGCGRELVLTEDVSVEVTDPTREDGVMDLVATWAQEPDSYLVATDECAGERTFTRWLERPRVELVPSGEAPAGSVVLGRVLIARGEIAVELSGRSTWRPA